MSHGVSPLVLFGIPGLAISVACLFVLGAWLSAGRSRRVALWAAAGVGGYFGLSGALAAGGVLSDMSHRPPAFIPMMAVLTAGTVVLASSGFGARLAARIPLWALVMTQGFRLPLEIVMLRAAHDGAMPAVMSAEGYNFDILTGATALVLGIALLRRNVSPRVVLAWNVMGAVLLAIVVSVALASAPWIQAFGPARVNTWILHFPYVWLPAILVQAALFGHIVVFRRLRQSATQPTRDLATLERM